MAVAARPLYVTPVSDGIEKYIASHAAETAAVMLASLVIVTALSAAGSLLATLRSDGQQTVDLHNGGRLAVFTLRYGLYREL